MLLNIRYSAGIPVLHIGILAIQYEIREEVMSRGISKLVEDGLLPPMAGPKGFILPSHILYVDQMTSLSFGDVIRGLCIV
ncbi:hypothetical protein TSUD_243480 [Trifolium subterraneum]|uniref:Uncharacterized protein n=1 Tax=Trifolium subterraneum TaxID=3900 RepID=A0A2Z6PDH4_TRISU|nr:hypothetical protein TSUD_243480 [Trifolium subterraneum]